jgi:hypothetical protein
MKKSKKPDWDLIKRDFVLGDITLKELSLKSGIPYGVLKNRSSAEKWSLHKKEKKKSVNSKICQEIQKEQVLSEVDIRMKNFTAATACLDKGLERLGQLTEDEIPPQLAIKMVELGIKGRHSSAGLPDKYQIESEENINFGLYTVSVSEATEKQSRLKTTAYKLEAFLKAKEKEVIDV